VLDGVAGSIGLCGFGFDSFIESISGGIMIWRFSQRRLSEAEEKRVEARAVRPVDRSFFPRAALPAGLLTGRLFGFRQADPLVGPFIGARPAREGIETLKEGRLCSC
jgi:hypothetical protein